MCLVLNAGDKSVKTDHGIAHLTPKEYGILSYLMAHPKQICTAEEIYQSVWNEVPYHVEPLIYVHMRRLRIKVEANPSCPSYIKAEWRKGYCLINN